MNDDDKRTALIEKITERQKRDALWGRWDFIFAQSFIWGAILASFISAIVAASGRASPLLVAFLSAIPGTVIVIDRSFSFARRARWHRILYLRLDELINDLQFRGVAVDEIARNLSTLRIEMQETFPGMSTDGFADGPRTP